MLVTKVYGKDKPTDGTSPKTGDERHIGFFFSSMLLSGCAISFLMKKRLK